MRFGKTRKITQTGVVSGKSFLWNQFVYRRGYKEYLMAEGGETGREETDLDFTNNESSGNAHAIIRSCGEFFM